MRIGKYEIDPILFEKGFSKGCGPFACESTCCSTGVYVGLQEKDLILSYKETVKKYMDETQTADDMRWFDNEVLDDNDFPSGKTIGTEVFNGKCVFLNKTGMCSLQVAGTKEGRRLPTHRVVDDSLRMGRWALKPFYCIAFPITVEDGTITFDDFLQGKTKCCSIVNNKETTVVESCKEELEFILGRDGYKKLLGKQKEFADNQLLMTIE